MKKLTRIFGLGFAVLMVLALVVGVAAQDDKVVVVDGQAFGASDAPTIDPAVASDTSSVAVISNTYIPLTILDDQTFELENGLIESFSYDLESRTYTFQILPDVPWVQYDADLGEVVEVLDENGDVRVVTAADFAYGIKRTLAPETAAPYQYVLSPYVDGLEIEDGAVTVVDGATVEAVDTYTLNVTVPEAVAEVGFVPSIFSLWFTAAQPQWIIDEAGEGWTDPGNYQSYGPFTVKEWNRDQNLVLIKNPFWPGTDNVPVSQVDEVDIRVLDASVSLAEFEAGNLDVAQVPLTDIGRIQADPELSEAFFVAPGTCTYYYGFNTQKAPFDDVRVRQAFSLAINRQSLVDNVLQGGQVPAGFFSRPELAAAPSQELTPDLGVPFTADYEADVAAAQALLQEYLDENGITVDELPPIVLGHNESEAHAAIAEAAQQMWLDAFGVSVEIQTQEWQVYLASTLEDAPHMFRLAWCLDFPDAHNFLYDVYFGNNSGTLRSKWSNDEFNELVGEAQTLTDNEARRELYTRADHILVWEDPAQAPIYYYTTLRMFSDRFDFQPSRLNTELYYLWTPNM